MITKVEELPENTRAMLVSAAYHGELKKVYLKFYVPETNSICFWFDRTKHKPYCYTKIKDEGYLDKVVDSNRFSKTLTTKIDLINDKEIQAYKITAPDPLAIGGGDNSIRDVIPAWEADIRYHETYIYDNGLVTGSYYTRRGEILFEEKYELSDTVETALKDLVKDVSNDQFKKYITEWAYLLNQPIPSIRRISIDIEVDSQEGRIPNPLDHDRKITAIGMVSNDGVKKVFVLKKKGESVNNTEEIQVCDTEKEVIQNAFNLIWQYPVVITYNGDDFDLPYLSARSGDSSIDPDGIPIPREENPILIKRVRIKKGMNAEAVHLKYGLHLDLFSFFQNRSIQNYAFSHKYSELKLGTVSEALLGDTKMEFEGSISELPLQKLAEYCLKDADLTFRLTSFNDDLLMKLLIVISRIARLPVDDMSRFGVNQWIKGMLHFEHRRINAIIPRRDELLGKGHASTTALIKGKKYRGGLVVEPTAGVHFNTVVADFASLYPSIVKVHNISYETVNCNHQECRIEPHLVPETEHWICKIKNGMTSLLIGSLRDLRVGYYKKLSKDKSLDVNERQLYNVVSQAVKVILNASYGVMGAEIFPMYCLPVAEATTALSRDATRQTIAQCGSMGIEVVYGDTDSLFLKNPNEGGVEKISNWARTNLGVDLELDKEYRYVVFSALKKNYIGVLKDGTVDVKGLTGKKSHTPPFIRAVFYQVLDILGNVKALDDFNVAKEKIIAIIKNTTKDLESNKIPLKELSFNVMVNKSPESYGTKIAGDPSLDKSDNSSYKGVPQHIKAAMLSINNGTPVLAGDIISYVKTKTGDGVKPIDMASVDEIDKEKYLETLETTLDQLLLVLDVNFKTIIGQPVQMRLDEIFSLK